MGDIGQNYIVTLFDAIMFIDYSAIGDMKKKERILSRIKGGITGGVLGLIGCIPLIVFLEAYYLEEYGLQSLFYGWISENEIIVGLFFVIAGFVIGFIADL